MENSKLSKSEMKKVLGGLAFGTEDGYVGDVQTLSTCTATCSGGTSVSVTCSPKESCVSTANVGAQCIHNTTGKIGTNAKCPSSGSTANMMSDAGSITMMSSTGSMLAQANTTPQSALTLLK